MKEDLATLRKELSFLQDKLEESQRELSDCNHLCETLCTNIDQTRFEAERKIGKRIVTEILPELRELRSWKTSAKIRAKLRVIEDRLRMIIPMAENPYSVLILLSSKEIQIASMIKDGFKSMQIADALNIELKTINLRPMPLL